MLLTILFCLASFGLTNIIVREKVFEKPKNWIDKVFHYSFLNKMLKCETCCGFWVGCGLFWMMPETIDILFLEILIAGFVSSAFIKITTIMLYKF